MAATEKANQIKEEATVVAAKAEEIVAVITVDQKAAEKKLKAAKPALDAAEAALLVKTSMQKPSSNLLTNIFVDYQSCRYRHCKKIGQASIFDHGHHGCCADLLQEESGTC